MEYNPEMTIAIVGEGNVGTHLAKALQGKCRVELFSSRPQRPLPEYADCIIITVKDDAIPEVAARLKGRGRLMAHTSGSVPLSALSGMAEEYGVFYPLQTFSRNVPLDYSEIPMLIEGNTTHCSEFLCNLASLFSEKVTYAGSEERKKLHLASVFACNFTNRLVAIADSLLRENGMDYRMLLPLMRQTIAKLNDLPPEKAQTGPAEREDMGIISSHLSMLASAPRLQRIYRDLTDDIISSHGNNPPQ